MLIIVLDFFRPSKESLFKSYEFSRYNLINRRHIHINFLQQLFYDKINIIFYIISFYIVLICYPFIVIISGLFTIYWFFIIVYTLYIKKQNFTLIVEKYDSSALPKIRSLLYYTFYSQPCFTGCSNAYNIFKKIYHNTIKVNVLDIILNRIKTLIIGFSYFFLSVVKELTICFINSYNNPSLEKKTHKHFVFYRIVLNNIFNMHYVIFNGNKNIIRNSTIKCGTYFIFNPPRSNIDKGIRSLSHDFIREQEKIGIIGNKVIKSQIQHVIISDTGTPEYAGVLTSNPLPNQKSIGIYGSKNNTGIVYNTIINPKDISSDISGLHHIVQNSGLTNQMFSEHIYNTINVTRQLMKPTDLIVIQYDAKSKTNITVREDFYSIEHLDTARSDYGKIIKGLIENGVATRMIEQIKEERDKSLEFNQKINEASKILNNDDNWAQKRTEALNTIVKQSNFRRGNRFDGMIESEKTGHNREKYRVNSSNSSNKYDDLKQIDVRQIKKESVNEVAQIVELLKENTQIINEDQETHLMLPTSKYENIDGTATSPERGFLD